MDEQQLFDFYKDLLLRYSLRGFRLKVALIPQLNDALGNISIFFDGVRSKVSDKKQEDFDDEYEELKGEVLVCRTEEDTEKLCNQIRVFFETQVDRRFIKLEHPTTVVERYYKSAKRSIEELRDEDTFQFIFNDPFWKGTDPIVEFEEAGININDAVSNCDVDAILQIQFRLLFSLMILAVNKERDFSRSYDLMELLLEFLEGRDAFELLDAHDISSSLFSLSICQCEAFLKHVELTPELYDGLISLIKLKDKKAVVNKLMEVHRIDSSKKIFEKLSLARSVCSIQDKCLNNMATDWIDYFAIEEDELQDLVDSLLWNLREKELVDKNQIIHYIDDFYPNFNPNNVESLLHLPKRKSKKDSEIGTTKERFITNATNNVDRDKFLNSLMRAGFVFGDSDDSDQELKQKLEYFFHGKTHISFDAADTYNLKWEKSPIALHFLIRLLYNEKKDTTKDNVILEDSSYGTKVINETYVSRLKTNQSVWNKVSDVFGVNTVNKGTINKNQNREAIIKELKEVADLYFECKK